LTNNPIIFCTDESNDADLVKALGSIAIPVPLPCGDVLFYGVGDNVEPIKVIIERKHVPDLASSIITGRYLHQVQLATEDGKADILVLILEGRYRPAPADGLLEIPGYDRERDRAGWKPTAVAITFSRFDIYLTELEYLAGIIVKHTENVRETAAVIKSLWTFYQKPPDDHQSLKAFYKSKPSGVLLSKPSFIRRVAAELPNVGWERSKVIAERFPTVKAMVDADVADWMELSGIGKKTAEKIVRALRGDKGD